MQLHKQQGLSVLGELPGSWSFASEQDAGKEAPQLEGAVGRMLTLSHSPLLSLQLPLISMAEGWLLKHRQRGRDENQRQHDRLEMLIEDQETFCSLLSHIHPCISVLGSRLGYGLQNPHAIL